MLSLKILRSVFLVISCYRLLKVGGVQNGDPFALSQNFTTFSKFSKNLEKCFIGGP
ncbi:hypothetical protein D3C86_448320 [compost metagenome]